MNTLPRDENGFSRVHMRLLARDAREFLRDHEHAAGLATLALVFCALLLLVSQGCTTGYVRAAGIAPVASIVCARHDAYVDNDKGLDKTMKKRAKRSSALLMRALTEAQKRGK